MNWSQLEERIKENVVAARAFINGSKSTNGYKQILIFTDIRLCNENTTVHGILTLLYRTSQSGAADKLDFHRLHTLSVPSSVNTALDTHGLKSIKGQ